jgi:DNA-binding PadR family transcriptional regulator
VTASPRHTGATCLVVAAARGVCYICLEQALAEGKYMAGRSSVSPDSFLPLTAVAFEILLALAEGGRHGYDIMLEIERRTGGRISLNPGTLYRALDRLAEQGLLDAAFQRVGEERRRLFSLSSLGSAVATAEARRLSDQVRAARAVRLLKRGV